MTKPLKELGEKAEALVSEEIVSGQKMSTFIMTKQKYGFAKSTLSKKAAELGYGEAFESNPLLLEFALEDWFNYGKHKEAMEQMTEVEASLYMKMPNRIERALEYAIEKAQEMEEDLAP